MTGAGRLPYHGVLMCVAIDPFHDSSVQVINQCTHGALELAAQQLPEAHSIALPVFASGNGQFNFSTALETMIEAITRHESDVIERCMIVVFNPVQVQTAKEFMQQRLKAFETIEQHQK